MSAEQYFLNGKYKLSSIAHEMRMSHWVYAPVLSDIETQEIILNLEGNIWDLKSAKELNGSIQLVLARYPDGNTEYLVELKPTEEKAIISGSSYPISRVVEVLDAIV